jgi:methanogenic corrinoid protein MtbC1
MKQLVDTMADMAEDKVLSLTQKYLDEGKNPIDIFHAYQEAMVEIGKRFEQNVYFIPELILAGEMMNAGSELIKPYLNSTDTRTEGKKGKFLLATVEGDIHDIGKNIIGMMMDLNGFEVLDLGVDVPGDQIIAKVKAFDPDIVGLSGLLTLAFDPMKDVVTKLTEAGLREKSKVIIGGAQLDLQICEYVGADAWVTDAVKGVNQCKEWMS